MIRLLTAAPAQIFAGEPCTVAFSSNRTGRGHIAIYAGAGFIQPLVHQLSAPIVAGVCQFDIGQLLEQYATGLSIQLRNNSGIASALPSTVAESTITTVRIVASDYTSALDASATTLYTVPLLHGNTAIPSGEMFMYRGVPELLRGAWAVGHIAPSYVVSSLRVRALRSGGYTDIIPAGVAPIPPAYYSGFAVNLQNDAQWRDAHTLELSAVLAGGSVYKTVAIPLRKRRQGDRQAYYRNPYGAFQPAVLHAWDESCSIKYSADTLQHQDTRTYTTGGGLRPAPFTATMKHIVKAVAGYYESDGSTPVADIMRSTELYVADSYLLRRMAHASKNSAMLRSMSERVLSADCTLMDYNHNDLISTRYIYDII